jgi:hypothetical protein
MFILIPHRINDRAIIRNVLARIITKTDESITAVKQG